MAYSEKTPVIQKQAAAIVVGGGAAGLAAAYHLDRLGVSPVALVCEGKKHGTSRNTGSDKQTYYKLSLAGAREDSVEAMAETLFAGGCMDGDIARVEAALSASCFEKLCDLGVPFPRNEYGEAVGYRTDHDQHRRATSAGPLTSRLMVEALEQAVCQSQVKTLGKRQVIRILKDPQQQRCFGVLCLRLDALSDPKRRFEVITAPHVVWAVGGPAMLYADSVYPESQQGAPGLALEAGASLQNATEWQYGLASIRPRWNVSGSFQQVIPRYVSCKEDGSDPVDFLDEAIPDRARQASLIFRKGYEWPFDARKTDSSSLIDLLVYQETVLRKRRVFLDFRADPGGRPLALATLDEATKTYLEKAGATGSTPAKRLQVLNEPALQFYRSHGIDLFKERLEIRLCAQHHNGGLAVDKDWQSDLAGFYPIGEAAGSHGVYRPGGSALNSGQVGARRAAQAIARQWPQNRQEGHGDRLQADLRPILQALLAQLDKAASADQLKQAMRQAQMRMSQHAGPFRSRSGLQQARQEGLAAQKNFAKLQVPSSQLPDLCRYRELLLAQDAYFAASLDYFDQHGGSRGSFLCLDADGVLADASLPSFFRSRPLDLSRLDLIQTLQRQNERWQIRWRPVRPLPRPDEAFEVVWRQDRERRHGDD